MDELLTMSNTRTNPIRSNATAEEKRLTQKEAAQMLGISVRQSNGCIGPTEAEEPKG